MLKPSGNFGNSVSGPDDRWVIVISDASGEGRYVRIHQKLKLLDPKQVVLAILAGLYMPKA